MVVECPGDRLPRRIWCLLLLNCAMNTFLFVLPSPLRWYRLRRCNVPVPWDTKRDRVNRGCRRWVVLVCACHDVSSLAVRNNSRASSFEEVRDFLKYFLRTRTMMIPRRAYVVETAVYACMAIVALSLTSLREVDIISVSAGTPSHPCACHDVSTVHLWHVCCNVSLSLYLCVCVCV